MQMLDTLSKEEVLAAITRLDKGSLQVNVRLHNHDEKFQQEKKDSETEGIKEEAWPVYKQFLDERSAGFRFMERLMKNRRSKRLD